MVSTDELLKVQAVKSEHLENLSWEVFKDMWNIPWQYLIVKWNGLL